MRKLRRICAVAMAVALATSGLLASTTPASAAVGSGAVFNDPRDPAQQQRIVNHVRSLIQGAATGSTISMAMYHFSDSAVAGDLVAAEARGVNVRVVLDYSSAGSGATATLTRELGTNRGNPSWLTLCTSGAACIGTAGTPIMHNKFYLFSDTLGSANVVVQSSANLNPQNATNYWNNAVTLVGNTGLYNGYLSYFNDLAAKAKNSDYYRTASSGNTKAYFFPRAGSGASTDTIYNMLNENVTCEGNKVFGTKDTHRTIIRVAMWYFSRDHIARKLRELADRKCWVDVIYTTLDAGSLSYLKGHSRIALYHIDGTYIMHSKYMLIEGTYAGQRDTKWVITGSHNYSNAALRENDEAFVRVNSNSIHDAYRTNFRTMRASVCPTC